MGTIPSVLGCPGGNCPQDLGRSTVRFDPAILIYPEIVPTPAERDAMFRRITGEAPTTAGGDVSAQVAQLRAQLERCQAQIRQLQQSGAGQRPAAAAAPPPGESLPPASAFRPLAPGVQGVLQRAPRTPEIQRAIEDLNQRFSETIQPLVRNAFTVEGPNITWDQLAREYRPSTPPPYRHFALELLHMRNQFYVWAARRIREYKQQGR